jgi:hypothetical protein
MLLGAKTTFTVRAQSQSDGGDQRVQIDQPANLFVDWEGRTAMDGLIVELPPAWRLREARFVRNGRTTRPLTLSTIRPGTYAAALDEREEEPGTIVLQVEAGGMPGSATWSVTPYVLAQSGDEAVRRRREAFRIVRRVRQLPPMPTGDNRVLQFRDGGASLVLRQAALPDLRSAQAHTVEFWMKTIGTDEVVLSTWTGDEQTAYPMEFVVGPAGHLFYYRGQPGQHTAMQTTAPVADGRWHHVAVTHDAEAGWTRMLMNGTPVDSLFQAAPRAASWRGPLALGGRVPGASDAASPATYTGALDEVRFWTTVRTPRAIQRTMRRSLDARSGVFVLGFDDDLPAALVERGTDGAEQVRSDLMFHEPVRDLRAAPEGDGVTLTWTATDQQTETFIVERSTDGTRFETIGRVPGARGQSTAEGGASFHYHDDAVDGRVVYYRVRQHFSSGAERLSRAIKLGLGGEQRDVLLVGNYPNPFTRATSISYEVHEAQHIRLSVWDLSGQRIATLVNRLQQPGYYEVPFTPDDLPSGTYFVRLRTASGIQTHKMTLAK